MKAHVASQAGILGNSGRQYAGVIVCSILAALACVGCATENTPITTDAKEYRATANMLTIVSTYSNTTGDTVYLGYCGRNPPAYQIEQMHDGAGSAVYSPICTMILVTTPFVVPPGKSHTDSMRIDLSPQALPKFQIPTDGGTYRLVYTIYSTWNPETGQGDPLPVEQRMSNEFRLRQ